VVSEDTESLHYAYKEDILDGTETWVEVTTGFVASRGPRAISSADPRNTWIVGAGGYVYYTEDPTSGVEVQSAGATTAQDLNDVDAFNSQVVVAVGNSNAVIYTTNGGASWSSVTGPAVGVNLTVVSCRSEKEWWVGTANGRLYVTVDQGSHWTEISFPGNGSGEIKDMVWASNTVGFMAHKTSTPTGRILRTISGGNSWFVVPEGAGSIPANRSINALAVCHKEVNVLYAAGLASGGADGIIIKGSATYA